MRRALRAGAARPGLTLGAWLAVLAASLAADDPNHGSNWFFLIWAAINVAGAAFTGRKAGMLIPVITILPFVTIALVDGAPSDDVWWTPLFFGVVVLGYLEFWTMIGLAVSRLAAAPTSDAAASA